MRLRFGEQDREHAPPVGSASLGNKSVPQMLHAATAVTMAEKTGIDVRIRSLGPRCHSHLCTKEWSLRWMDQQSMASRRQVECYSSVSCTVQGCVHIGAQERSCVAYQETIRDREEMNLEEAVPFPWSWRCDESGRCRSTLRHTRTSAKPLVQRWTSAWLLPA